MSPVQQDLSVVPGTTYRDTVRLMQPLFAYCAITTISGAPARVVAASHGLVADWPAWVRGVSGLPAANREPPQLPHRAQYVDGDTLEINKLSAAGAVGKGGELLYRLPVDLAGAELSMRFSDEGGGALFELAVGTGLTIPSVGTITRELSPAQTEQLVGGWRYVLDVTFADGTVTRYFEGGPARVGGCCG